MAVSFYLSSKNTEKTSVVCICHAGQRYKAQAKISVLTKYWDADKQCCRVVKDYPDARKVNEYLYKYRLAVEAVAQEVSAEYVQPSNAEFWRRVDFKLTGGASSRAQTFVEYFDQYIERRRKNSAERTITKYVSTRNKLLAYEKKYRTTLHFRDINLQFYEKFEKYITEQGYTRNYFGAMMSSIKVAYRDAREVDGLHNLRETEKRGFTTPSTPSKSVYLTSEELQRIADVEISVENLKNVFPEKYSQSRDEDMRRKVESLNICRNKFLLGAYTALRVSDFNHLSKIHITDGFFRVTTRKTGAAVVIPIHPTIKRIMDSGFDIATPITEQKINAHIKEVARLAGITQPVEATKFVNHRAVVDWWPKCDVITTHTARRSAATNMYKAGIPSISIMRITGHTTEKSFMKYIKITAEENAELMARNAFFMA